LGAPEADTALSVLPAHQLLLEGKGYEAVALSAIGSYGAIIFCFLLLYLIRFVIGAPLFFYSTLREIMLFVLIAISILM
ncbi:MAG: tripartite tricarboxylate transporter permease, partial [Thermoplasmatales archaeon]|nr:tripartite tricarboxylate transporter permease [Thermoplasmatales archaeon]